MNGLKRRTFLRGLGLSVGLPLLDIMTPESAARGSQTTSESRRMAFVFFANGAIMDSWKPKESGSDYELPRTLKQLSDFKSDFNIDLI